MQATASWLRLARTTALAALVAAGSPLAARAQFRDTIPSQLYYSGVQELYSGNFRDAQRTFTRNLSGAVKTLSQGGTIRWIDSICYHTMLGETFYHWGQPDKALEQFNYACSLYLQYPKWMLRVQFPAQPVADAMLARTAIPWGVSQRNSPPARFNKGMAVAQGQLDNSQQVQQGGVVSQAQFWTVDVIEINRCTALAIRRRNEILGPLGPHDAISKNMVTTLSRGGAPPNHWSGSWIDVQRGIALAGVGDSQQALQYLDRGLLVAGQLDHPLTCIALLEQGRLALQTGNLAAAANLLAEASYSAYLFQDYSVIDDAFRWGELSRGMSDAQGLNPALAPAQAWARRDRLDYISARLSLVAADQWLNAGDLKNAAAALAAGGSQLRDAKTGYLGNWALFLEGQLQFQQNRESAANTLAAAVDGQRKISLQNYQINLANRMFDAQTLPTRTASSVYEVLLADPKPAETALRPLETMGVMTTSHEPAFERWLLTALERKNIGAALEITDRAKRRRFHNALPWGGRLAAVRDILVAPAERLTPERQQQQHDLLARFPEFSAASASAEKLRSELDAIWRPPLNEESQKKAARLWGEYSAAIAGRERMIARVAAARVPASFAFPPLKAAADLQQGLQPGQGLLVYHDTSEGLIGLFVTPKAATSWNCGPSQKLMPHISQFLRDCGNVDGNHEATAEELTSTAWKKSGEQLYKALFGGASLDASSLKELIIVPDGVTWYIPFEAIVARVEDKSTPIVALAKTRYAPTAALAFSFDGAWRRVQRTGLVAGDLVPGEKPEQRLEVAAALEAAVDGPLPLANPLPAASPLVASMLDSLIVLDDSEMQGDPLDWSPLPLDKSQQQGALEHWLALPKAGPQRIALPGMRTAAERGGKVATRSRRAGAGADGAPGDDLFFASCGLISAGAETMLLSRWRVGGQSTLDLVREFMQELPRSAAADAWQRSVQLAMEMPIDPASELRVRAGKTPVELTAAHPFFWAGYIVVDTGWRPEPPPAPPGEVASATGAPPQAPPPATPPQEPPPAADAPDAKKPADAPPPVPTPPTTVDLATNPPGESASAGAPSKAKPKKPRPTPKK